MNWKHFIFVLLYGLALCWRRITASKPGYLDFDNLPETNFSCNGKVIGGYYADVETGCQMFHVCTIGQKGEVTDIKFLCLNGTVFDQETRVCERIDEVDCSKSEDFFGLNLELYGNSANFGIQPENEFECEDCSTDDPDDDYDESDETTTFTTTTSTTTTTTTPRTTTTLKPTTPQPVQYSSSSPDTIAALIALHNAFNQGLQNSKIKPPPPRVINNAFSPTNKPSPKPYPNYTTQRPNIVSLKTPQYTTQDSQSYGSLNLQQRERPYFFTPAPGKSNYHHFQSGDASFGHSFDSTKPYNFQYFHSRRAPDDRASVSIVTSTSTSTSVKKSKNNSTQYPTGYEDYQEDIEDSFFQDVPKIRQKREQIYNNHKYETTTTTYNISARYLNHKYDDENIITTPKINSDREEFLQNLLGSIDFEDQVREKLKIFLKKEREEMDKYGTNDGIIHHLGNKMETLLIQEFKDNNTRQETNDTKNERIQQWKRYFEDMRRDINLNYTFEDNGLDNKHTIREKRNARKFYQSKDLELIDSPAMSLVEEKQQNKRQTRKQNIDTERFNFESSKRRVNKTNVDEFIPVTEAIEGDVTTVEYRRTSAKRNRNLQRTTIRSRRPIKFNYEQTTPSVESDKRSSRGQVKDTVHEESVPRSTQAPAKRSRGRVRGWREPPPSTEAEPPVTRRPTQAPDPNFSCQGKVKGGFYSDIVSDCRGFFICSQGEINGPLLKSHFWCGDTTKFNQRSRTCQAEDLVECSISTRYFHLNDDFLVPVSEDELKGSFEAKKVR